MLGFDTSDIFIEFTDQIVNKPKKRNANFVINNSLAILHKPLPFCDLIISHLYNVVNSFVIY